MSRGSINMSSCESTGSSPGVADLKDEKQFLSGTSPSHVASAASQLRDVRRYMTDQHAESLENEIIKTQVGEEQTKVMERESCQAQTFAASLVEQHLKDLEDVRLMLAKSQDSGKESDVSIHLSQSRFSEFLTELDKKMNLLDEHESQAVRLGKQFVELNQDFNETETSQRHLREDVLKLEQEIKLAVHRAGTKNNCELRRILDEVSARNIKTLATDFNMEDEEIARLKEEMRLLSSQIRQKNQDLEAQLEKQQRDDQEIKKKVLKLEFCLQETRSQTRKLLRIAERRDKELKELMGKALVQGSGSNSTVKLKFWENPRLKYIVSLTMVILVAFAKH